MKGLVTVKRDSPVTSIPIPRWPLRHVPRLRQRPHFYSSGSLRACSRRHLALSSKGLKDSADWCQWRSVPFSLAQKKHSSPLKPAGKSSLLQILAGKKLIKGADVTIKGLDVFYQFPEGVTFLGTEWSVRPAHQSYPAVLCAPSHPFPGP